VTDQSRSKLALAHGKVLRLIGDLSYGEVPVLSEDMLRVLHSIEEGLHDVMAELEIPFLIKECLELRLGGGPSGNTSHASREK